METWKGGQTTPENARLETFLRGMETRVRYPEFHNVRHLETFLRGVETQTSGKLPAFEPDLETFLRGMETPSRTS